MLPLVNIGLRAARIANLQVVRAMDRLDIIREKGQQLGAHLHKLCQAAETTMAFEIHKAHPEQQVIGLLSGAINPPKKPTTKVWHVNGIEGLEQYARSIPSFCLTMAYYEDSKITHGIIIDSANGDEYFASKGRGAQLNGRRIRTSKCQAIAGAQLAGGFAPHTEWMHNFDQYQAIARDLFSQGATLYTHRVDSQALAYVASSRLDGIWHSQLDNTIDAALLLAKEAGALVADFKGGQPLNNKQLVCANPKLLKHLLRVTNK